MARLAHGSPAQVTCMKCCKRAPHHDKTLCQGLHHILVVLVKLSCSLLPTAELLLQTGKPISLPLNCSLQQSAHGHHLLTASLPSTNWLPCGKVLVASATELHIKGATRQQQRTVLLRCLPSPKLEVSLIQSPGSAWSSAEVESKFQQDTISEWVNVRAAVSVADEY